MPSCQSLPDLWLLSDKRNDASLGHLLGQFTAPIGFVFRHYHLPPAERFARYRTLRRIARAKGHLVILAGSAATARNWGADGIYAAPPALGPPCHSPHRSGLLRHGLLRHGLLRIATAHNLAEIAQAGRMRADAVMLSPVFPTRSHPGGRTLGALQFLMLAKHARAPVIALGGMNVRNARRLNWQKWAAIDGHKPAHGS